MHKPIALATSAALLVTGCQSKSLTWHKVMATPKAVGDAERRDRAYAAELHGNLGATPHKVVTFEVDYFSKLRGSETTQRTAVFYHDEQNQKHPWWVMDSTLDKPVWLPNRPLPEQVSFFARRHARVVEVHDYTVSREKSVQQLELARRPVGTSKLQRVKVSGAKPATTVVRAEPAPEPAPAPAPRKRGIKWKFWEKTERKADTTSYVETAPKTGTTTLKRSSTAKPNAKPVDAEAVKELDTPKAPAVVEPNGIKEPASSEPNLPEKEAPRPVEKAKKSPAAVSEKAQPSASPKAGEKTSAAAKRGEKPADKQEEKPAKKGEETSAKPAAKAREASGVPKGEKPEPATEPKKRRPLFHRETPEPATPRPADGADVDQPRRNLFQRILGTLNPTRWFRRAV